LRTISVGQHRTQITSVKPTLNRSKEYRKIKSVKQIQKPTLIENFQKEKKIASIDDF